MENSEHTFLSLVREEQAMCQGVESSIDFHVEGPIYSNNNYTLELSDRHGSFDISYPLAKWSSDENAGIIEYAIPTGIAGGDAYRIRLRSSSPAAIGLATTPFAIHAHNVIEIPDFQPVCVTTGFVQLPSIPGVEGYWTGQGVEQNRFLPPMEGVGSTELTFHYSNKHGCRYDLRKEMVVVDEPEIDFPEFTPMCSNSVGQLLEATPTGGYWIGDYVNNDVFDPKNSGSGIFEVTYIYPLNASCTAQKTTHVEVYKKPDVWLKTQPTVCEGSAAIDLEGGIPAGGQYWGEYVENVQFRSEYLTAGEYELNYTYTGDNGCSSTATDFVTIASKPDLRLTESQTICSNHEPISMVVGDESFKLSGNGLIDRMFYPGKAGRGKHEIQLMATNEFGCSINQKALIEVIPSPETTIDILPVFCREGDDVELLHGKPAGGIYTVNGTVAKRISPDALPLGEHTLSYFYENEDFCMGVANRTIHVVNQPVSPRLVFDGQTLIAECPWPVVWKVDGIEHSKLHGNAITPQKSGTYSCFVRFENCDSHESESMKVEVRHSQQAIELTAFPNPFEDEIRIQSDHSWSSKGRIQLFNQQGRTLLDEGLEDFLMPSGAVYLNNDRTKGLLASLHNGNYVLILSENNFIGRIIIQHTR